MRGLPVLLLLVLVGCGSTPAAGPEQERTPERGAAAPTCPGEFEGAGTDPWVPAGPTTETDGRLVPDADPVEAVVCRYAPLQEGPARLEGEVVLRDGRNEIRHDLLLPERLDGQDRACTLIGGPMVPHLMRLSYADGDLWVSALQEPNSCTDSGNGDFVTSAYLGERLSTAYDTAGWPPPPAPRGCTGDGSGRAGQEQALVPDGWAALVVCTTLGQEREVEPGDADRVAELLQEVGTEPGSNGCAGTPRTTYHLLFRYPVGPPVALWFAPGCEPPLHNGSLDAALTRTQAAELEDLLAAP